MEMGLPVSWTPRQKALSAAAVVVASAARRGRRFVAADEAEKLLSDYPDCGMTIDELEKWIDQLCVNAARNSV